MAWEKDWNTDFGNNPEDTESRKYGAQQIRWLKDAIVERMQVDHEFGEEIVTTGTDDQNDTGYHKRVTLLKTTNAEPASGYTALAAEGDLLTYFPEGDSEHTLADLDSTQTLTNKTLTTPTIASFANAAHDHSNAAGGGRLGNVGYARIDGDGTNGAYEGLITGISRDKTGEYIITYDTQTAAKVIAIVCPAAEGYVAYAGSVSTTQFKATTLAMSASPYSAADCPIFVHIYVLA